MSLGTREKYLEMLDELYNKLPKRAVIEKKRFSVPNPEVYFEGRRTVIINFKKIVQSLNREVKTLSAYLAKELAAPVVYEEPRLIIQARIDLDSLSAALSRFIKRYVMCPACGGPDTKLIKKKRLLILKCEICGAESVVESI